MIRATASEFGTVLSDDESSRIYYLKCRSGYRASSNVHFVFISISPIPNYDFPPPIVLLPVKQGGSETALI